MTTQPTIATSQTFWWTRRAPKSPPAQTAAALSAASRATCSLTAPTRRRYRLFAQQVEFADVILLNKCDLVSRSQRAEILEALKVVAGGCGGRCAGSGRMRRTSRSVRRARMFKRSRSELLHPNLPLPTTAHHRTAPKPERTGPGDHQLGAGRAPHPEYRPFFHGKGVCAGEERELPKSSAPCAARKAMTRPSLIAPSIAATIITLNPYLRRLRRQVGLRHCWSALLAWRPSPRARSMASAPLCTAPAVPSTQSAFWAS